MGEGHQQTGQGQSRADEGREAPQIHPIQEASQIAQAEGARECRQGIPGPVAPVGQAVVLEQVLLEEPDEPGLTEAGRQGQEEAEDQVATVLANEAEEVHRVRSRGKFSHSPRWMHNCIPE